MYGAGIEVLALLIFDGVGRSHIRIWEILERDDYYEE